MAAFQPPLVLALLAQLFLGSQGFSSVSEVHATPITKVVELLKEMHSKGVSEKEEEKNRYTHFAQWCDDQTRIKTAEIKAAGERADMLSAEIQKADSQIRGLSERISELEEDVGRWKKDQGSASDVRSKEKTDFVATQSDYAESLEALAGAITVLKKQAYDREQAELVQVRQSLLQVQGLKSIPLASKKALAAFLQQAQPGVEEMPDQDLFKSAPEAYGYEFQSGGVVEMLEKLKDQFRSKKYELEMEEMNAQHAFDQIMQQLTDNTENANHEISKKQELRAETQQGKAESEGDLAQTKSEQAEDQKYLDETTSLCHTKKQDFESREKLRGEELEAIQQAVDILSSDQVAGAGEKHLPSLLQKHKDGAKALAQLRSSQQNPLQTRIASFLADRAHTIDSRLLEMVSQRVAADPFGKVKKLIKDLISKLMQESTAETEHKGWCDTELTTNKQTRDSKSEDIDKLQAQVEDLTTTIAGLTQDIADRSSEIKELDSAMAQATADRTASKEKNEETIKDAKDAQLAITQATGILKDFYAKSAEATALAQQTPGEDAPETFAAPYKGMLPEGGNVVSFLEVILSDFARLETDTSTSEAMEVDAFKKYMFESEKSKALKQNEIEHKEGSKTEKQSQLHSTEAELKMTQDQLEKAVAYYEKLKPTCVDSGITYEERVKRREEEIQSLQEALKILAGTDINLSS